MEAFIKAMHTIQETSVRESLRTQGFVLMRSVIDPALLRVAAERVRDTVKRFDSEQPIGDLPYCVPLPVDEHFALLDHAESLLIEIGADPFYLQNLMLIMKRPHEGRRYWHTDLPPIFAPSEKDAPQLFVLYFLQDTTVEKRNGCLLVVPGYAEGPQHSQRVTTPIAEEYPIEVQMGDVIIFDPRLLHGSLENETDEYRFNIRLWVMTRWRD